MINMDRKTCRDILRLTSSYDACLFFDPVLGGYAFWHGACPETIDKQPSIKADEVAGSLSRLVEAGLIKKIQGSMNGGMIFRVTPELRHYKAFWFDRFTKTYLAGFISGVGVSVISGLLIHFLTGFF